MWNVFKVNNKNIRRCHWRCSGVFIVSFEHISQLFLLFLLWTFYCFLEQVNVSWNYLNRKRNLNVHNTAQKMKFSIKGFFRKCDQIRSGFGHISWRNSWWKTSFFMQCKAFRVRPGCLLNDSCKFNLRPMSGKNLWEGRSYPFKFFNGCCPLQIFFGPFLNTLSHINPF